MAGTDEQFSFIDDEQDTAPPDATGERGQRAPPWKVLSVEDDRGYQASLTYGLRGLTVLGRPVELLSANSATEAAVLLANQTDIGLILLDVVMEEEDAGLRLVETIRNTLGNQTVRIVLLTGQPGVAPRARVIQEYDINEYWNKSELQDRLPSIVTTNLRTWQTMAELEQAHMGLQMVVEASQHLADRYDLQHFSDTVLQQIAQVIGLGETGGEGILCLEHNPRQAGGVRVLSSFGAFRHSHRQSPDELSGTLATFAPAIDEALRSRRHQFQDNYVVLYFPQNALLHEPGDEIVHTVLLKTPGPLSEAPSAGCPAASGRLARFCCSRSTTTSNAR
jgi:CheY-like chemotaxis protein